MIGAVIFDMDGVLIDSERWILEASAGLLAQYGVPAPREALLRLTGSPEGAYDAGMAELLGMEPEAYRAANRAYYRDRPMPYGELVMPGAAELLTWARERGYALGLGTSDTRARTEAKFEQTGLGRFFSAVLTDEMVEHSKPHPETYLRLAALLGAEPGKCLVVEDSARGVAAAKAAGMTVAARYNPEVPQDISRADHQFEHLLEVRDLLERIGKEAREA